MTSTRFSQCFQKQLKMKALLSKHFFSSQVEPAPKDTSTVIPG